MRRIARANVSPIRQRSQFSCVSASTCMALNALGVNCTEDDVNKVIGAKPMQGARWEEVLACAQYFGCRATLTTPATLTQIKRWTDTGKPVLIAWNPEGREWSHASLIFDVVGEPGEFIVHIADPNIPNPNKTVREVTEDEFYSKWFEKWPNYLVRRPALMLEREIDEGGRQIMASMRGPRTAGMLQAPASMVRAVYAYVLSTAATEYIRILEDKSSAQDDRLIKSLRIILASVEDFKKGIDTKGTKDLYESYELMMRNLQYLEFNHRVPQVKRNAFTGLASPSRRQEIKDLFEEGLNHAINGINRDIGKLSTNTDKLISGLKSLITVKVPSMNGKAVSKMFPIILEDWYLGQESLLERNERLSKEYREFLEDTEVDIKKGELPPSVLNRLERRRDYLLKRIEDIWSESDIRVQIEPMSRNGGYWSAGIRLLNVEIDTTEVPSPENLMKFVWRVVVHEMTHAAQTILSDIQGNMSAGLPSSKIRTPEWNQGEGNDPTSHVLDDREFYTDLRDAIRSALEIMNSRSGLDRNLLFRRLVSDNMSMGEMRPVSTITPLNFFRVLKEHAPLKWRKAVGEAYKIIFR